MNIHETERGWSEVGNLKKQRCVAHARDLMIIIPTKYEIRQENKPKRDIEISWLNIAYTNTVKDITISLNDDQIQLRRRCSSWQESQDLGFADFE